jgi:hypothetical protein
MAAKTNPDIILTIPNIQPAPTTAAPTPPTRPYPPNYPPYAPYPYGPYPPHPYPMVVLHPPPGPGGHPVLIFFVIILLGALGVMGYFFWQQHQNQETEPTAS